MVFKWIKQNIIGDLAEERRKFDEKRAASQGREQTPVQPKSQAKVRTRSFSNRDFGLPIVGESHYQDALRQAKASVKDYSGASYIYVIVTREPENQFDKNAIKVTTSDFATIGYLSREKAVQYGTAAGLWDDAGYALRCQAKLSSGYRGKSIGAWLDLDSPQAITEAFHSRKTRD